MVETLVVKGLKTFSDEQLVNVLLYGPIKFTFIANVKILRYTIKFLKALNALRVFFFKRNY